MEPIAATVSQCAFSDASGAAPVKPPVMPEPAAPQTVEWLGVIYADIGQRLQAITEASPQWPCRQGCDACCRQLARIPEFTAAEWHTLQAGLRRLAPATQQEVAQRIHALAHWQNGPVTCPFLDDTHGACLVYAHRPAACRMYGFYVSRQEPWWCAEIQARYEAGMGEGTTLGNHDAVQRRLQQQGGELQSLLVWFRQGNDAASERNKLLCAFG